MPRDASGNYTRTNGVFTGSTTWAQQAASADKTISSARHDTHDQDIAVEVTDSLSRSGKGGMLSNLDLNNFKGTNLANGTVGADAINLSQLNALEASLKTIAKGHLWGLDIALSGVNNATVTTAAGQAMDDAAVRFMTLASAFVKDASLTFAEGTGNGGFAAGESLPASGTVHIWLIAKADDTADVLINDHATSGLSPVLPSGFVSKRRIGSRLTDASSNLRAAVQNGDDVLLSVPIQDENPTNPGTNARLVTLAVPAGIKVKPKTLIQAGTDALGPVYGLATSPDQADSVPTGTLYNYLARGNPPNGEFGFGINIMDFLWTNTARQIRTRLSASGTGISQQVITSGWVDSRDRY